MECHTMKSKAKAEMTKKLVKAKKETSPHAKHEKHLMEKPKAMKDMKKVMKKDCK